MKIAALFCIFGVIAGSPWNDADETRRINQIKHDEQRAFEMQMRGQNPFVGGVSRPLDSSPFQTGLYSNYPHQSVNPVGAPIHRVPIESRPGQTAELRSEPLRIEEKRTKNWCFHCSSPWHSVGEDLQMALKNLLDMRRARFPATSYTRSDCSTPKNVSDLPKQDCGLSYCQTLFITDHNQGSTMTIRGCAEKYGAVDNSELERRGDNVCKKFVPSTNDQFLDCTRLWIFKNVFVKTESSVMPALNVTSDIKKTMRPPFLEDPRLLLLVTFNRPRVASWPPFALSF